VARKEYAGGAPETTLTSSMTAGSPTSGQTFTVASGTGYPTGAYAGGFVIVVDVGTASEEKILCSARSGTTFTVASSGRGFDGTTAVSHGGGTTTGTVNHCIDADSLDDFGEHIALATAAHAATAISNTPAGNIAATTVQAAINELDTEKSATSHSHTIPTQALFYTTHTWAISGTIAVESSDTDFIIPLTVRPHANETWKLARVDYKINSGTSVTFDITVNGTGATGFTSLSATTTTTSTDPTDVSLSAGDKVKPDVSAVSGTPKNWEVTVVILHTVTLS
jgi:hypothetical protein